MIFEPEILVDFYRYECRAIAYSCEPENLLYLKFTNFTNDQLADVENNLNELYENTEWIQKSIINKTPMSRFNQTIFYEKNKIVWIDSITTLLKIKDILMKMNINFKDNVDEFICICLTKLNEILGENVTTDQLIQLGNKPEHLCTFLHLNSTTKSYELRQRLNIFFNFKTYKLIEQYIKLN